VEMEIISLIKISWTQKEKYVFHHMWNQKKRKKERKKKERKKERQEKWKEGKKERIINLKFSSEPKTYLYRKMERC
jgi:hypothetical protein